MNLMNFWLPILLGLQLLFCIKDHLRRHNNISVIDWERLWECITRGRDWGECCRSQAGGYQLTTLLVAVQRPFFKKVLRGASLSTVHASCRSGPLFLRGLLHAESRLRRQRLVLYLHGIAIRQERQFYIGIRYLLPWTWTTGSFRKERTKCN